MLPLGTRELIRGRITVPLGLRICASPIPHGRVFDVPHLSCVFILNSVVSGDHSLAYSSTALSPSSFNFLD